MKNKTQIKHIAIILFFYILLILLILKGKYIWASNVDFIKQHAALPDYFRNLFYETGDLFPNFAKHLGAGQNIFYFAYYGLLNPIIMLSYLLPFLDMTTYIIISHLLLVFVSTIMLYFFLQQNSLSKNTSLFGSLLFLFSSCLLFHSHRHIMFINYMPFLIMALWGVKAYFKKQKSSLLILSTFLIILTSFYFSIPSLLAICFYGLYLYIKTQPKITFKDLTFTAFKFILHLLLGILLSAFFLLPVAYVILHGRSSNDITLTLTSFLPHFNLEYLMYDSYGVGATAILWICNVYHLVFSKKENRILAILLTITTSFPLINYLLNGGLYANGKCFIPFLPLYILLIGKCLEQINKKDLSWKILFFSLILSFIFIRSKLANLGYFSIDLIITFIVLYFYSKKHQNIYLIPILIIAFTTCLITNQNDDLLTIKDYQNLQNSRTLPYNLEIPNSNYRLWEDNTNNLNYSQAKNDQRITMYSSTTNPYYADSFYNIFNNNDIHRNKFMFNETNNLFFHRFMGIKYLITNKNIPYGYQKIKDYNTTNLYETNNVLPIGFASSHLLNINEYKNLAFNEQLESFGNNIIIDGLSNNANLKFLSKEIDLEYEVKEKENLEIQKNKDHYLITSQNHNYLNLNLTKSIENQTLIIRFKMNEIPNCKEKDPAITINNVTNKLTCATWKYYNENETFDYVLSSNEPINSLKITFVKGDYDISDLKIYSIPNTYFANNAEIYPIELDENVNSNTILKGTVDVLENGYFIFTIPYDKGFTVLVDDELVNYEKVNEGFIGFPIRSGNHQIELQFEPPWQKLGIILSLSSLIITSIVLISKKRNLVKK